MNTLLFQIFLVSLFNRYPIKIVPSTQLDLAARYINVYQFFSHIPVGLKFLGFKKRLATNFFYPTMFVYSDNDIDSNLLEFLVANILDFVGWLAIFSRLKKVPLFPKTIANTHMASAIVSLLGHETFKKVYLMNSDYFYWDLFRAIFVLSDSVIRGYYHFYVFGNI